MKIRRYVAKDMRTALAQIKEELGADAVIMSNKKIAEGVELMAAVDYNQNVKPAQSATTQNQELHAAPEERADFTEDTVAISQAPDSVAQSAAAPVDSLAALLSRQVQQNGYDKAPATRAFNSQIENSAAKVNNNPAKSNNIAAPDIEQQFKNFTSRLEQSNPLESAEQSTAASHIEENSTYFNETIAKSNTSSEQNKSSSDHRVSSAEFDNMQKEMSSIRQLLEHQMSGLMWQDMAQKAVSYTHLTLPTNREV